MRKWMFPSLVLSLAASLALTGVAGAQEDQPPKGLFARGEITEVDLAGSTFSLHTLRGEDLTFQVNDETHFASPDGAVDGLEDLHAGLAAGVAAEKQADGTLLARRVGVGRKEDGLRVAGEITGVVPGQGTFTLESREGASYTFHTSDRTRFVSRDGSVQDIHDLKKGMHAVVGAVKEDGGWLALLVAVGKPEDRPDVRLMGRIVGLGDSSLTVEKRNGETVTVAVTEATKYKSRGGKIDSFDDLELGMPVVIAAQEANGKLTALWIAVGQPPADRPADRTSERTRPSATAAPNAQR
jgi:Domain of unknown function (DUF5666)